MALAPCNVVVALAGYRRETRRITLDLDPVRACRLADLELRSGMSAEAIIRDLLDDAIFDMAPPSPKLGEGASRRADISSPSSIANDRPSAIADETSTGSAS